MDCEKCGRHVDSITFHHFDGVGCVIGPCPAWADGQHLFVSPLETRLDMASDVPIGHAVYARKICVCGAEVKRT